MKATQTGTVPHITWAIRVDMPQILEIEQQSFEDPWDDDEFNRNLRKRNCIAQVARIGNDGTVGGYMIYELQPKCLHLLNLAVHKDYRRQGIGRMLVERLVGKLSPQRRTKITCEVGERNLDAQLFFKRLGFRGTGVLKDFYELCDLFERTLIDAYAMEYRLVEHE